MSHSALSAQLATLNNRTADHGNVGSRTTSSRRHDDTVGRGAHYSARHGHSLRHGTSQRSSTPTIVFADGRDAADVPSTTVHENAVESVRALERGIDPRFGDEDVASLFAAGASGFERDASDADANRDADARVAKTLRLCSDALVDRPEETARAMEWLVRRYDAHRRPTTADALLRCVAPHHGNATLFGRTLRLVDLAELPTWTFLRPYVATDGTTTRVPRSAFARRAAKDDALAVVVCDVARSAAVSHVEGGGGAVVRRGLSHMISFSAAVLSEALTLQRDASGSLRESTMRRMLPFLLSACGSEDESSSLRLCECPDYRAWGYLLVTSVCHRGAPSDVVREVLANTILDGAFAVEDDNAAADALIVIMVVATAESDDDDDDAFGGRRSGAGPAFLLPSSTFKRVEKRAAAIGRALGHVRSARGVDVSGLLRCLASGAMRRSRSKKRKDGWFVLLETLIREPSLRAAWSSKSGDDVSLSSGTAFLVVSSWTNRSDDHDDDDAGKYRRRCRTLLAALRSTDPSGHDDGVARAVRRTTNDDDHEKRRRVASLLSRRVADSGAESSKSSSSLLPPSIAAEDSDPTVRVDAVRRLASEDGANAMSDDVVGTLLRRVKTDDDVRVATTAAAALRDCSTYVPSVEDVVVAVERWSSLCGTAAVDDDRTAITRSLIDLCRRAAETATPPDGRSLEILAAHAVGDDRAVAEPASEALVAILGTDDEGDDTVAVARRLLTTHPALTALLADDDDDAPSASRRAFVRAASDAHVASTLRDPDGTSAAAADAAAAALARAYRRALARNDGSFATEEDRGSFADRLAACAAECGPASTRKDRAARTLAELASAKGTNDDEQRVGRTFADVVVARIRDDAPSLLRRLVGEGDDAVVAVAELACRDDCPASVVSALLRAVVPGNDAALPTPSPSAAPRVLLAALHRATHADRDVRHAALDLLRFLSSTTEHKAVETLCDLAASKGVGWSLWADLSMDGARALPSLLRKAAAEERERRSTAGKGDRGDPSRVVLLRACAEAARGGTEGGRRAACSFLSVAETLDDSVVPLAERWERTGAPALDALVSETPLRPVDEDLLRCAARMLKGVVVDDVEDRLVVTAGPSSGGRTRSYSVGAAADVTLLSPYPADMMERLTSCLTSENEVVRDTVIDVVVRSSSWTDGVLRKTDAATKRTILEALLRAVVEGRGSSSARAALTELPMNGADLAHLWSVAHENHRRDVSTTTFLVDCVRGRTASLAKENETTQRNVVRLLLDAFRTAVSRDDDDDDGSSDHLPFSLARALAALRRDGVRARLGDDDVALLVESVVGSDGDVSPLASDRARAAVLDLLVLASADDPSVAVDAVLPATLRTVSSSRDRTVARRAAGDVLSVLVPAYLNATNGGADLYALAARFVRECASLDVERRFDVHDRMAEALAGVDERGVVVGSFAGCYLAHEAYRQCATTTTADDANDGADHAEVCASFVAKATVRNRVDATSRLLDYANGLLSRLTRQDEDEDMTDAMNDDDDDSPTGCKITAVTCADLIVMSTRGPSAERNDRNQQFEPLTDTKPTTARQRSVMWLVTHLLSVVVQSLSDPRVKKLARSDDDDDKNKSDVFLRAWQNLVRTQAEVVRRASSASPVVARFWEAVRTAARNGLERLQRISPVPRFLVCTTALLRERDVDPAVRKRTLAALSDRAADADPSETSLFLETIPDLVGIVTAREEEAEEENDEHGRRRRRDAMVRQTALSAIERLAQALLRSGNPLVHKLGQMKQWFMPVMEMILRIVTETSETLVAKSSKKEGKDEFNIVQGQLLGSAVLCAGTVLSVLKQKCVSLLSKLLNPVLSCFISVNKHQKEIVARDDYVELDGEILIVQRLIQKSTLRTLLIVSETLPNFLSPFLATMFSPSCVPSSVLRRSIVVDKSRDRQDPTLSLLTDSTDRLCSAIAARVPPRTLVPVLSSCVATHFGTEPRANEKKIVVDWSEARSTLSVLRSSVEHGSRSELGPLTKIVVDAVTVILDRSIDPDMMNAGVLDTANECVMSLVMKMSEAQLRPLYARFREWKDGSSEDDQDGNAKKVDVARRYSFWSLSAVLSRQLKSIFLPCFSTVLLDVVKELETAVSVLTPSSSKASKRRRLDSGDVDRGEIVDDDDDDDDALESLRPFQPVLSCLEAALKADAHQGGDWCRADEGHRYKLLLTPLSKLLQAKIPSNFPVTVGVGAKSGVNNDPSAFRRVVQGVSTTDDGSVTAALIALAAAAGNEQLWKPLNLAITDACGNEGRAEVRKAGVDCLLRVLRLLGEEYMVLLPECLPVLSELLEESDEEIVTLAKECLKLGEELLGESLEDSLM